jgi:hypothetical protein
VDQAINPGLVGDFRENFARIVRRNRWMVRHHQHRQQRRGDDGRSRRRTSAGVTRVGNIRIFRIHCRLLMDKLRVA